MTLVLLAPSLTWADPTVHYPQPANHIHSSVCPAADGVNILVPDPIENANEFFLRTVASQAMVNELAAGDTPYPGWTFQSTAIPLTGDFYIDEYESKFKGAHWSGCEIQVRYKRGPGDPPAGSLRWVQDITTTDPIDPGGPGVPPGPPTSPYIDPYPDDADGQGGPFYYSDELDSTFDYRKHTSGAKDYGFGTDYDSHFYDFPSRPHPPTSFVKWEGELFLTKFEPPKNVIFLAGIDYGFEAGCINWDDFTNYTIGSDNVTLVFDIVTKLLQVQISTINVVNNTGSQHGVSPQYLTDPANHATMTFQPFKLVENSGLPLGLALFKGGSVQIFSGPNMLYSAQIPYLVVGDSMHQNYNMTGVYANIQSPPTPPSQFMQQYRSYMAAGYSGPSSLQSTEGEPPMVATDRSNPGASESPSGTTKNSYAGWTPQFFIKSARSIPDLLTNGGSSPGGAWHSFGKRDPAEGMTLKVDKTQLSWGHLGKAVRYDVVSGDVNVLHNTGNFAVATTQCLANDTSATSLLNFQTPLPGGGLWYLVRAVRGAISGTWDEMQPSQVGSRDAGIAASIGACP